MSKCKNCKYFERNKSQRSFGMTAQQESEYGNCHLNPPTTSTPMKAGGYTTVNENDWCGQFAQRKEPEEQEE